MSLSFRIFRRKPAAISTCCRRSTTNTRLDQMRRSSRKLRQSFPASTRTYRQQLCRTDAAKVRVNFAQDATNSPSRHKRLKRQWNQQICAPSGNSAMDEAFAQSVLRKKKTVV